MAQQQGDDYGTIRYLDSNGYIAQLTQDYTYDTLSLRYHVGTYFFGLNLFNINQDNPIFTFYFHTYNVRNNNQKTFIRLTKDHCKLMDLIKEKIIPNNSIIGFKNKFSKYKQNEYFSEEDTNFLFRCNKKRMSGIRFGNDRYKAITKEDGQNFKIQRGKTQRIYIVTDNNIQKKIAWSDFLHPFEEIIQTRVIYVYNAEKNLTPDFKIVLIDNIGYTSKKELNDAFLKIQFDKILKAVHGGKIKRILINEEDQNLLITKKIIKLESKERYELYNVEDVLKFFIETLQNLNENSEVVNTSTNGININLDEKFINDNEVLSIFGSEEEETENMKTNGIEDDEETEEVEENNKKSNSMNDKQYQGKGKEKENGGVDISMNGKHNKKKRKNPEVLENLHEEKKDFVKEILEKFMDKMDKYGQEELYKRDPFEGMNTISEFIEVLGEDKVLFALQFKYFYYTIDLRVKKSKKSLTEIDSMDN